MSNEKHDKLINLIADMEEDEALELTQELIDEGADPTDILEICRAAMDIVGQRFEDNEYFVPELILAGEMLDQMSEMVKPLISDTTDEEDKEDTGGTVLIGTVHGDLHDIGKNIVTFMLDVNGFKVIDLGVDVSPQAFIDAIKENSITVVGLSGFLTLAFDSMKETVEAITEAGLRDDVKIMIGGGQVDEQIRGYTGADSFGLNAMSAVNQCKEWLGEAA
ncbi:MAG: methionine synthase [Rhodospirillaceae bacterium]|jgi:5-methyltetrahydrofolate--homocysteine methyltransferase|nr:methionine synthase [Rhodospirillaceae bacterium]MBT4589869.1 methionine synthase [Rhodospirillaceae bacterium]MBT4941030.1 methionine synthase [Rhodospirillaceae bacterium]MBT5939242.1 methionine synthase [Rhodospirillaceae bacterium]MBT7267903.1 methionine synthase [Rhodospirillaceae bacterium]